MKLEEPPNSPWIFTMSICILNNLIAKSLRFQLEIDFICNLHIFLSREEWHLREGRTHKIEHKHKIQNYVNKLDMQGQKMYSNYSINHSKNNMGSNDSWKNSKRLTPLN